MDQFLKLQTATEYTLHLPLNVTNCLTWIWFVHLAALFCIVWQLNIMEHLPWISSFLVQDHHIISHTFFHTQSSWDMSRGFTYSKPSNSDWSILLIILLKNKKKRFYHHWFFFQGDINVYLPSTTSNHGKVCSREHIHHYDPAQAKTHFEFLLRKYGKDNKSNLIDPQRLYSWNLPIIWGELNWFISELWVKVFQISLWLDSRFIRWGDLFLIQHLPVYCAEEWVRLNICKTCLWMTSKSLSRALEMNEEIIVISFNISILQTVKNISYSYITFTKSRVELSN